MYKQLITLISILFYSSIFAAETCSRLAIINKQEVLVDTSANTPGEGLRGFLTKDPVSEALLDEYQENVRPNWKKSAISTIGLAAIIGGLFTSNDNDGFFNRSNLLVSGGALIITGYFINLSLEYANENRFIESIDEYNKRNEPKIFLLPSWNDRGAGVSIGLSKGF